MEKGQKIIVESFDHEFVECRFVAREGATLLVCSEQEWRLAKNQKREPECLGWPLGSIQTKERASPPQER
jgi:hypothetical protein